MQWAQVDGKTRLLVAGKLNRLIPNPTLGPVAKPGAMDRPPTRTRSASCET